MPTPEQRRAWRKQAFKGFSWKALLGIPIVILLSLYLFLMPSSDEKHFRTGEVATGTVIRKYKDRPRGSLRNFPKVEYRFEYEDRSVRSLKKNPVYTERVVMDSQFVSQSFYDNVEVGDVIEVVWLRSKLQVISRIEPLENRTSKFLVYGLAIFYSGLLLVWGWIFVLYLRDRRQTVSEVNEG